MVLREFQPAPYVLEGLENRKVRQGRKSLSQDVEEEGKAGGKVVSERANNIQKVSKKVEDR